MTFGYIVSLLLSYLAGLYFSGDALAPVKHVVREVNQITQDNLSYRLKMDKEASKVDEIDELVLTFNALLKRIESAFISQKRFVQNASHELKTPLTAIMAEAELALAKERPVEEYQRTLNVVLLESERLVRTTQGLLTLTRLEEAPFQYEMDRVILRQFGQTTLSIFKLHHPDREVEVERSYNAEHVKGHEELLRMAVLNMLDNAVKYSTGKIIVRVKQEKGFVSIGVQDFGIGIPAHELSRIKSPLFRGSKVQQIQGAGLGLPLVDRIMKVHDGYLEISSEEGVGTYCEISIPAED
jgi:signal transduction histidine kinase